MAASVAEYLDSTDPGLNEVVAICNTPGFGVEMDFAGDVIPIQPAKETMARLRIMVNRILDAG